MPAHTDPPTKSVTQRDVAQACGVSQMAVSLALRGDSSLNAETIERIQRTAAEMGYNPANNQAARRMVLRRHGKDVPNHLVALLVPDLFIEKAYYAAIFRGIMQVLTPERNGLLLYSIDDLDTRGLPRLPMSFSHGEVDGLLILARPEAMAAVIDTLRRDTGFGARPVVSIIWEHADCSAVTAQDEEGAYQAMRHLLALGHRQIAQCTFVLKSGDPHEQRLRGSARAFRDAGRDPAELLTVHMHEAAWLEPNTLAWQPALTVRDPQAPEQVLTLPEYLARHPQLTALWGANDTCALHAWRILEGAGYRIPQDISLLGFDDTDPRLSVDGVNLLASVRIPLEEMGRLAARHLLWQINGEVAARTVVQLPMTFIPRASLAPPRMR